MFNKLKIFAILFIFIMSGTIFILIKDKSWQKSFKQNNSKSTQAADNADRQIIFFYGKGCPHCALVEDFFKENNVEEKIKFKEMEVYNNRNNFNELSARAEDCGLPTDSIGVPFLWDGEKCLIGDKSIINFFKRQINKK